MKVALRTSVSSHTESTHHSWMQTPQISPLRYNSLPTAASRSVGQGGWGGGSRPGMPRAGASRVLRAGVEAQGRIHYLWIQVGQRWVESPRQCI
jgi:hypothetical protein